MKIDTLSVTKTKPVEQIKTDNLTTGQKDMQNPNLNKSYGKDKEKFTPEFLERAVDVLNEAVNFIDKKLQFEIHETTNRTMVKVINRETEEVIREIPPEEILDLVGKITEMVGILMDKRV
ncbi:flagellar protein FlaG [Anaerobranca gottschalkii]|uniref:Flagellar protein FlaG n=1 Tax=Anaerobranca gottschalkii DSM 13577 TaxID=1120990 RepID=A0A1H9ZHH1_9FIRM|nr:flagellar protein FlaG [Anaerobranca gottschalkii]SES81050.1 flagellar protein FlaG [Anaerobranca gottschalkii DSM 13577]